MNKKQESAIKGLEKPWWSSKQQEMKMKKYKKNQVVTYHDTGEVSRVRVIEDNSTDEEISLQLEHIEIIRESAIVKKAEPGFRFLAWANRDNTQCGWFIEEEPEEEDE